MAANVTQKDKTLREIIEWCKGKRYQALKDYCMAHQLEEQSSIGSYGTLVNSTRIDEYTEIIDHCKSLLGYSGTMPTEVPNQSKDAK